MVNLTFFFHFTEMFFLLLVLILTELICRYKIICMHSPSDLESTVKVMVILGDEDSFVTVWDGEKAVVSLLSEIIGLMC